MKNSTNVLVLLKDDNIDKKIFDTPHVGVQYSVVKTIGVGLTLFKV